MMTTQSITFNKLQVLVADFGASGAVRTLPYYSTAMMPVTHTIPRLTQQPRVTTIVTTTIHNRFQ